MSALASSSITYATLNVARINFSDGSTFASANTYAIVPISTITPLQLTIPSYAINYSVYLNPTIIGTTVILPDTSNIPYNTKIIIFNIGASIYGPVTVNTYPLENMYINGDVGNPIITITISPSDGDSQVIPFVRTFANIDGAWLVY